MSMMWQKLLAPEPAVAGYSCTITIGDYFSLAFGYDDGYSGAGAFGSLDAEPVSGETMNSCTWLLAGAAFVAFTGNITSLVGSLNVWLGGVNYGGSGSWSFDGTHTTVMTGTAPSNTSGTILLELK